MRRVLGSEGVLAGAGVDCVDYGLVDWRMGKWRVASGKPPCVPRPRPIFLPSSYVDPFLARPFSGAQLLVWHPPAVRRRLGSRVLGDRNVSRVVEEA